MAICFSTMRIHCLKLDIVHTLAFVRDANLRIEWIFFHATSSSLRR